jgi:F-type H+-transporting ATPase subunit b
MRYALLAVESVNDTMIHLDGQFLMQVGFLLLNAVIAIGIVGWLMYEPVRKFLRAREERVSGQLERAGLVEKEAGALKAEYEDKVRRIESERDSILSEARKIAFDREQRMITGAKKEANLIMERAAMEIERDRLRSASEIKRQIVEVSTLISGRYLADAMSKADHDRLIDEAVAGLGDVEWIT